MILDCVPWNHIEELISLLHQLIIKIFHLYLHVLSTFQLCLGLYDHDVQVYLIFGSFMATIKLKTVYFCTLLNSTLYYF